MNKNNFQNSFQHSRKPDGGHEPPPSENLSIQEATYPSSETQLAYRPITLQRDRLKSGAIHEVSRDGDGFEISRLRAELGSLRVEKTHSDNALDEVLSDLCGAQDAVEESKASLARKEVELKTWRDKASRTHGNEQEQEQAQEEIARLTALLQERDAELAKKASQAAEVEEKWLSVVQQNKEQFETEKRESEERARAEAVKQQREQEEEYLTLHQQNATEASEKFRAALQATKAKIEIQHGESEARSRAEISRLQSQLAENGVQAKEEISRLQTQLGETDARAREEITGLQTQLAQAQEALQNHQIQMRSFAENSQKLHDAQTAHAAELDALRRQCQFFKSNSERLSKQIKSGMAGLSSPTVPPRPEKRRTEKSLASPKETEMVQRPQQHPHEMELDGGPHMPGTFG